MSFKGNTYKSKFQFKYAATKVSVRQLEFTDDGAVLRCTPPKQDRRLVVEPVNATKLAGLSVFEQE